MEHNKIEHMHLPIRGISLHVAHIGKGEKGTAVFVHGFPEIWYSWRHQMLAIADFGFQALAPDLRGYGLSDHPPELETAAWEDLVADIIAILDALSIPKAFIIGKDFGAKPAFDLALHHPDRICGIITLGVPFSPRPLISAVHDDGFYIKRWREPGRAEADFNRFSTETVVRAIYILFSRHEVPVAGEGQEVMDLVDPSAPLPSWFSDEDLAAYTALYEKSGLRSPLQIPYRTPPEGPRVADPTIRVPSLLIMGEKDYIMKFSGLEDYVRSGKVREYVPELNIEFIPEGSHFVQEQFPALVNQLIITFLRSHACNL